eukprot:CAMPEP_0119040886 /NCGR_PEP_ID=MMETSP1177-20130426/10950_1 /TAXON_ID=2985 /ORGANISM="Ochromonas sp, Strain CCMP1899" /LENGTH=30 /DNA_ID= /DNA_START= /DNA_END= /DNA_ORIENTATION=
MTGVTIRRGSTVGWVSTIRGSTVGSGSTVG